MKWRHPLFFFLILCMLGVSPSAGADISRWPSLYEKGSYQTRVAKTNQLLWKVQWESLITQHEQKRQVEINEKGDGKPWGYSEPIHWEKKMEFDVAPSFMFRSVTGERTNTAGKKLSHLTIRADSEKSVLFYEDQESPDKPASRTKKSWNPKTIPDEILFQWVRSLNFTQSPAGECELVTSPTRRLKMIAFVRGVDTITTPAGTFSCYRIELTLHLGVLALIPIKRLFMPKLTIWCTTQAPHFWVRYQGPVGGPGSPEVAIELTHFEQRENRA